MNDILVWLVAVESATLTVAVVLTLGDAAKLMREKRKDIYRREGSDNGGDDGD